MQRRQSLCPASQRIHPRQRQPKKKSCMKKPHNKVAHVARGGNGNGADESCKRGTGSNEAHAASDTVIFNKKLTSICSSMSEPFSKAPMFPIQKTISADTAIGSSNFSESCRSIPNQHFSTPHIARTCIVPRTTMALEPIVVVVVVLEVTITYVSVHTRTTQLKD